MRWIGNWRGRLKPKQLMVVQAGPEALAEEEEEALQLK
jgi:hypothetical protein